MEEGGDSRVGSQWVAGGAAPGREVCSSSTGRGWDQAPFGSGILECLRHSMLETLGRLLDNLGIRG